MISTEFLTGIIVGMALWTLLANNIWYKDYKKAGGQRGRFNWIWDGDPEYEITVVKKPEGGNALMAR